MSSDVRTITAEGPAYALGFLEAPAFLTGGDGGSSSTRGRVLNLRRRLGSCRLMHARSMPRKGHNFARQVPRSLAQAAEDTCCTSNDLPGAPSSRTCPRI